MAQTSQATHLVSCPFCGYPYPMTGLQFEVYQGRNMGCMNCGRPFKVEPPRAEPPAPEAQAPEQPLAHPQAEPFVQPEEAEVSDSSAPAGDVSVDPAGPGPVAQPHAVPGASAAGGATAGASAAPKPRPNPPATISFVCAILFLALVAAAAVCSAAASDADAGRPSAGWMPQTPAGVLTALAMGAAVLAVLSGAAGLVRTRHVIGPQGPRRTAGRVPAIAGMVVGGGGLLLTLILLTTVMPLANRQHELARREVCKTHLQAIATALANYANSNNGQFPDSLDVLVASATLSPDDLVCPSTGDTPVGGASPAAQASALQAESATPRDPAKPGHLSYRYAAKALTGAAPADAVLVYEPISNHGEVGHVLFRDGMILPVRQSQSEPLRRELEAGQNPGPTAHLLHP